MGSTDDWQIVLETKQMVEEDDNVTSVGGVARLMSIKPPPPSTVNIEHMTRVKSNPTKPFM